MGSANYGGLIKQHMYTRCFLLGGFTFDVSDNSKETAKTPRRKRRSSKTLRDLLTNLSVTEGLIKKSMKYDPRHMQIAFRTGVYVLNEYTLDWEEDYELNIGRLENYSSVGLPTEFAFTFDHVRSEENDYCPRFCWATKAKLLKGVQFKSDGDIYEFGSTYDVKGKIYHTNHYISVCRKTGKLTPLKALQRSEADVGHGKNRQRITNQSWKFNPYYCEAGIFTGEKAAEWACHCFCIFYNTYAIREHGAVVHAKKGKIRMTFDVPRHEWKYFFKDRIKVKTPSGRAKPIFHWVRAHYRQLKNGRKGIKTHMRGLRSFVWDKYKINIAMPGLHGAGLSALQLDKYTSDDPRVKKDPERFRKINDHDIEEIYSVLVN